MLEAFGLFLLLRILFGGGFRTPSPGAQEPAAPSPSATPSPTPPTAPAAPPWPVAPPATLPPWPAGWEYDEPPPPEVVRRAQQLLTPLWAKGEGSKQLENVGGRWIYFVAAKVKGGLKGVTAFRPKRARA